MLPIDQTIPERLKVFRTGVAIIDVIRMLPHVAAEDRRGTFHQRIFAVGRFVDRELAVLDGNPTPARAKLSHAGRDKVCLRLGESAEIALDRVLQLGWHLVTAAALLHPLPELNV